LTELQSAYRAHHSTETAVLKVLADILSVLDTGDVDVLTLLDLSAAFDTVDHASVLRRLKTSYDSVLEWFTSYLSGRIQSVRCGMSTSDATAVLCGVLQGSVLGPILFLLYTADLLLLVERHNLQPHIYADDTQIYGFCRPVAATQLQEPVSAMHVSMYRRRSHVDAVKPAPAEHYKDRSYLVRIELTAASTTTGRSESWY